MKPYYQDEWVTQYCDDALSVLSDMENESIDLLCTDPPYGIGFMGKDWDKALPDKKIWAECLRVLKPGAFAFVMSIPRADCLSRMIISLEDAGFNVGFTPIYWAYASGFPKAQNIGKVVDKRRSCDVSKYIIQSGKGDKEISNYCGVSSALVRFWRLDERQVQLGEWQKLKELLGVQNKSFDANLEEAEREVIGKHPNPAGSKGNTFPLGQECDLTISATPQAKALDGSYGGFQPKPAVEVIIVAMKPLSEKTFVDQALKNGKGITWLDDCRILYESENKPQDRKSFEGDVRSKSSYCMSETPEHERIDYQGNISGRFPANLLVSDDVLNDGRERLGKWGISKKRTDDSMFFDDGNRSERCNRFIGDSGSFSRYFDLDKWTQKTFPFLIVPKASKSEKNKGCEGLGLRKGGAVPDRDIAKLNRNKQNPVYRNNHPTVKPLKLMSYLVTLGSRAGDTVLDPFGGSGTTALASKLLGRKCIGIEISEAYCEIAANRCRQMVFDLRI